MSGHLLLTLALLLPPIVIRSASAATDTTPPVWPSGSKITALSITPSSISISWTLATDDSGVVNYRVYENGGWNGMYNIAPYGRYGLAPNTTLTFLVTAGDASNNWSNGPSATFSTAPAQCAGYAACLVYVFTHDTTSFPGSTVTVNGTVTNEGQVAVRVSEMTVSGDLGAYSLTRGIQFFLGIGERGTRGLVIGVPLDEAVGTHSLVFSVLWQYNSTDSGWTQGNDIVQSGSFVVTNPPVPYQPYLPWLANVVRRYVGYIYLVAVPYFVLVSLAVVLVIRDDRRKRAALLKPQKTR